MKKIRSTASISSVGETRSTASVSGMEKTGSEAATSSINKSLLFEEIGGETIREIRTEIERLSKIVYGRSNALDEHLGRVNSDPRFATELSESIRVFPQFFSRLAGIRLFGVENMARKRAMNHVSELSAAVNDYVTSGESIVSSFVHEMYRNEIYTAATLKKPSQKLQDVLTMPPETRREVLACSSRVRKELSLFMDEINRHLTPEQHRATAVEDYDEKPASGARDLVDLIQRAKVSAAQVEELKEFEKICIPGRQIPPLTKDDIAKEVARDPYIQEIRQEVQRYSKIVYGYPKVFDKRLEQINADSGLGKILCEQIQKSPQAFSKFVGFGLFGTGNRAYRQARDHVDALVVAVEKYTSAARFIELKMLQERGRELRSVQSGQAIEMPSERLKETLSMPQKGRKEAFMASSELQDELFDFMNKINIRFSKEDYRAVRDNDHSRFAKSMNVPRVIAKDVVQLIRKAEGAYHEHVFIPSQKLRPLRSEDISERIAREPSVQKVRQEVERLSKAVYGHSEALNESLDKINEHVEFGRGISERIRTAPKSFSRLSGTSVSGFRSSARKEAERRVPELSDAVNSYAKAVRLLEEKMIQERINEQISLGQAVRMPSKDLQNVLSMPKEQQKEILGGSLELQEELSDFMDKIRIRFSSDEYRMVKEKDSSALAESLDVSQSKAEAIVDIVDQTREAYKQVRELELNRSRAMAFAI